MPGSLRIIKIRKPVRRALRGWRRGEIVVCAAIAFAVLAFAVFAGFKLLSTAGAQSAQSDLPTPQNPVIAKVIDPANQPTDIQPLLVVANGQLHVSVPEPASSFRPGRYRLQLWIWQNGVIYYTENDFTWGVLAVNFNKSIYRQGDRAKIGFAVLDDRGHTLCNADIGMNIAAPSGQVFYFSTQDKTISRNSSCGPGTVTNNPDYSASLVAGEAGTYSVSVTATTQNGTRRIADKFDVQNPPLFDVARSAPTRIFPPATYNVSIPIKANADFNGDIVETVPASFNVFAGGGAQKSFTHEGQIITWPVNLKKGDSVTLNYSFKAPDISPELYKLGPLRIGNWSEERQWQIAADVVTDTVIFITSTASTTWTVPSNWNNSSNTIEVIGGGGGGSTNTGTGGSANRGGAAGGGGAYAKITNFSTSTGNLVKIGVGGGGAATAAGILTYFNWSGGGTTSTCSGTTMQLCAMGGGGAVNGNPSTLGSGGASSTSVGTVKNGGGNGGSDASSKTAGAGGGGAGGSSGDGLGGTNTTVGTGGAGDNGAGGAGGAVGSGTGGPGAEWTSNPGGATAGSGGGGGGSNVNGGTGGTGGNYGGGGGGGKSSTGFGGVGQQGIIVITYTPRAITIGNGTQAANVTVGPGANATTSDTFTLTTNFGASTVTNVTTTLSTSTGVYQVQITDSAGGTIYGSSTNPTGNTVGIATTLATMSVSTTTTTFLVRVQPLNATSMPATPISGAGAIGGLYVVTSTVTGLVDTNTATTTGANTTSSVITIDNLSPANVTGGSGTASGGQVAFSWTNPPDTDFATTTVVRTTSTVGVTWRPVEGTYYATGTVPGSATNTIACAVASSTASCTDAGLTNGTTYYYMIFAADNYLNYSSGTVPTGNPFTPSANTPPTVSAVSLNGGSSPLTLNPNATTSFNISYTVSDANGCADINTNNMTSTVFRKGVASTCAAPNPAKNNLNCYLYVSRATSSCGGTSINVTDTVALYYFAQSTGNSSATFPSDHWEAYALANDAANTTSSATSSDVDVGILLAINVTTSSIDYGTVPASSTTGSSNSTTTVQNVGNASQTLQINGTALTFNANVIATSSQHYATSSFSYLDGGPEQVLQQSASTVPGFKLAAPSSTAAVQRDIFWGIGVSASNPTGIYTGTNVFTAVWSP